MMFLSNTANSNTQAPLSNNTSSTYFNSSNQQQLPSSQQIAGGPWVITTQEHQQNEGQFIILRPVDGLIGGDQARPYFLKSGLPATVLAQIWQLADVNKDGKLDRLEFSIAMKLVRNCLSGLPLPSSLPNSILRISGMSVPTSGPAVAPFLSNGGGRGAPFSSSSIPSRPMSTYGSMQSMASSFNQNSYGSYSAAQTPTAVTPPFLMGIKELGDWNLPQPLKLRFSQRFNQLDKSRIGLLTGQQARGVLGESQLPTNILAQIWNMSDVNKDGCLSIEEFCTAMFLIEMVKAGYALPSKLPNELHVFCNRSKTISPSTTASIDNDPSAPPPQKPGHGQFKTFEDKRKDNLDKGQAELDRRRQILREEEERRRAEIERREREEAERKERERQELEQRRETELEAERQREREIERERAAEEERLKAEREENRRRLEQERIRELEKIRARDLENQLQAETEKSTQIQQRQHTMAFQLQALEERSQQLNGEITGARDNILDITQEIEGMREQRDQKLGKINELERNARELAVQSERFSHENLQHQTECQRQLSRVNEIAAIRNELAELDEGICEAEDGMRTIADRTQNQEKLVAEKRPIWEQSREEIRIIQTAYSKMLEHYDEAKIVAGGPKFENKLYEMPPDASVVHPTINSFDNKFKPDFAGTSEQQNSIGNSVNSGDADSVLLGVNNKQQILSGASNELNQQQHGQLMGQVKTVKYKVLFEFKARSGDELTIQPGDVVLVFEGHKSEPGWLAGQIRDKVGWFPASFAEPLGFCSTNRGAETVSMKKGGSLTGSPSGEPLASIQEEGEPQTGNTQTSNQKAENAFSADFISAFTKSVSMNDATATNLASTKLTQSGSISASASISDVLYDLPPTDKSDIGKQRTTTTVLSATTTTTTNKVPAGPLYELPPGDEGTSSSLNEKTGGILATGVALYQWKARNELEMSFSRGDVIEVLEQGEMRWRGRLQRNKEVEGWFPKSYVKVSTTTQPPSADICDLKEQNKPGEMKNAMGLMARKSSEGAQEVGEWFIALYQFDAVESTDLSLKPGDKILVIDQRDQWWRGTCDGRTGVFPANYVQRIDENTSSQTSANEKQMIGRAIAVFEASASNQLSLKPGDLIKIHQTTPGGWWEGEIEKAGVKQIGWFPGNYVQTLQSSDEAVMAVASFDYTAQHDDELTFKAGDPIEVVDHSDNHWWKGRKQGQSEQNPLLFPANFVQISK